MASFTVDLTPALRNMGTEGSLDTSINSDGNSIQRTYHGLLIETADGKKMVGNVADGGSFTNVIADVEDMPNVTAD